MDRTLNTLGGALWIDLANTIRAQEMRREDRLLDPQAADEWLADHEWPDAVRALPRGRLIAELGELRPLCGQILADLVHRRRLSGASLGRLSELAGELNVGVAVSLREDGGFSLAYEGRSGLDALRHAVLRSIAETLRDYPADRIRKCEQEACVLHFVDTSRSGKRRWCRMETCGNRHKAAEFYARQRAKAGR